MYVAWFRDESLDPNQEDHEWVACIVVRAGTPREAQEWGDHLARSMCQRNPEQRFLSSDVHLRSNLKYTEADWAAGPTVSYGEVATDEALGW